MRLVITQPSLKQIVSLAHRALFAGAIAMLGYCGFVLIDSWNFQSSERKLLARLLNDETFTTAREGRLGSPSWSRDSTLPTPGGLVGRVDIPRLGLGVIVIEGTSITTLRRAVGHISGTALPGQKGNIAISGHRDTFFRPLRDIEQNDIITLTTLAGEYRYRVVSTKVVDPTDLSVLNSSENEILTLVTCYPFYFVGPAPKRFIVRAERAIRQYVSTADSIQ